MIMEIQINKMYELEVNQQFSYFIMFLFLSL